MSSSMRRWWRWTWYNSLARLGNWIVWISVLEITRRPVFEWDQVRLYTMVAVEVVAVTVITAFVARVQVAALRFDFPDIDRDRWIGVSVGIVIIGQPAYTFGQNAIMLYAPGLNSFHELIYGVFWGSAWSILVWILVLRSQAFGFLSWFAWSVTGSLIVSCAVVFANDLFSSNSFVDRALFWPAFVYFLGDLPAVALTGIGVARLIPRQQASPAAVFA